MAIKPFQNWLEEISVTAEGNIELELLREGKLPAEADGERGTANKPDLGVFSVATGTAALGSDDRAFASVASEDIQRVQIIIKGTENC
jgi:hypothetical protein